MSEDLWAQQNTNPDAIEAALRELLRARHAENECLAPARVLNLVVIVDREWKGEIANRLERVGRYHASRTILCAVEYGRDTLDATAVMSFEEPKVRGGLGVMAENVEIDLGPEHLPRVDTIVDPVLVSELPTIVWSPHGHQEAVDALRDRGMIDVMLLDSDDTPDATDGLERAAKALEFSYVVDLAWLRTTPWRERLAASFDPADRLSLLEELCRVEIRHGPVSNASSLLLAGWLSSRLRWEPAQLRSLGGGALDGALARNGDQVEVHLEPTHQDVPGLAGVTVDTPSGFSLSLDRARGGLHAKQRRDDGREFEWQVLGASRGEGGILGEGVRQALLRDSTYGPALRVARELSP
jgi:glucose-6-phosphate dehydrogenase assembly protein OpcA